MKKSFSARFMEVVEELKEVGKVEVINGDKVIIIKRSDFDRITEKVADFTELGEYSEALKHSRGGTHYFCNRRSHGDIEVTFEAEEVEEQEEETEVVLIVDRKTRTNMDWFRCTKSEVTKYLSDIIDAKDYYKGCDVLVNGEKIWWF